MNNLNRPGPRSTTQHLTANWFLACRFLVFRIMVLLCISLRFHGESLPTQKLFFCIPRLLLPLHLPEGESSSRQSHNRSRPRSTIQPKVWIIARIILRVSLSLLLRIMLFFHGDALPTKRLVFSDYFSSSSSRRILFLENITMGPSLDLQHNP